MAVTLLARNIPRSALLYVRFLQRVIKRNSSRSFITRLDGKLLTYLEKQFRIFVIIRTLRNCRAEERMAGSVIISQEET